MSKSPYYDKQGLWALFLICAFPLFFWTLLLAFRDVSWLTARTNIWDAIGVISYGMIFAFIESLLFFIVAAALGFLVSRAWSVERRVALLGVLALIIALWAIAAQTYFLLGAKLPAALAQFLITTKRPVLTMYVIALALVAPSISVPTYLILHSEKSLKAAQDLMERISTLTMLYLFLAFVGLIIIIIRNIP
ncbi:MAG: hypothetical protein PHQ36_03080 [Anaerolineales bacterium]|nr:hypothetical protein [Anaerolineales bacterium]